MDQWCIVASSFNCALVNLSNTSALFSAPHERSRWAFTRSRTGCPFSKVRCDLSHELRLSCLVPCVICLDRDTTFFAGAMRSMFKTRWNIMFRASGHPKYMPHAFHWKFLLCHGYMGMQYPGTEHSTPHLTKSSAGPHLHSPDRKVHALLRR